MRYSLNGKRKWIAAGTNRAKAQKIRDAVAARLLEASIGVLTSRSSLTLSGFSDTYLDRMEQLRPKSAAWRRDRLKQVLARLGATELEALDVGVLDRYAHERLEAGKSVATVNGEIAVLRHLVGCAVRWKEETGLAVNRLASWRPLRGDPKRAPRFLDEKEVRRVVTASAVRGGPCHVFVKLFLATGARPGELLRLERKDFVGSTVRLPALKGGVSRTVVVDSELVNSAAAECHNWTDAKVRAHWRWVRRAAKLPGVRFYDLRHTVASEMLRRGATVRDVQRLFGHQTARMTERYAHFAKSAKAVDGLDWSRKDGQPAATKKERVN